VHIELNKDESEGGRFTYIVLGGAERLGSVEFESDYPLNRIQSYYRGEGAWVARFNEGQVFVRQTLAEMREALI